MLTARFTGASKARFGYHQFACVFVLTYHPSSLLPKLFKNHIGVIKTITGNLGLGLIGTLFCCLKAEIVFVKTTAGNRNLTFIDTYSVTLVGTVLPCLLKAELRLVLSKPLLAASFSPP